MQERRQRFSTMCSVISPHKPRRSEPSRALRPQPAPAASQRPSQRPRPPAGPRRGSRGRATYREDSPLKLPPSSSRTLQKRMPLTKGTEESSSSSSSTRNLNFFFFTSMAKDAGRGAPAARPHGRSAPRGSSALRRPPRSAPMPRRDGTGRGRLGLGSAPRPPQPLAAAYMAAGASLRPTRPAPAAPGAASPWPRAGARPGWGPSPTASGARGLGSAFRVPLLSFGPFHGLLPAQLVLIAVFRLHFDARNSC